MKAHKFEVACLYPRPVAFFVHALCTGQLLPPIPVLRRKGKH